MHWTCTLSILLLIALISPCTSAGVPKQQHSHTHSHGSKERVEDGAHRHHDSEGGHHSEFDHEAILGSVKEAEEFDNLSPVESKRRLSVLVTKMDLNADRFVDRHELKSWILRSFRMLSEEEVINKLFPIKNKI